MLDPADVTAEGVNPLCGDECRVTFNLRDGRMTEIRVDPKGCAISRASASMMTEAVAGKALCDVRRSVEIFKQMLLGPGTAADLPEDMEDVEALEGVKVLPARIKCALLAWDTLLEGMKGR